jgi:hypothetical protein
LSAGDPGLSFVRDSRPRDWWAVKPSGGWADDCAAGEVLAREYLLAERSAPDNASLGWIILEMVEKGDRSGLVVGFARELLRCAKLGLDRRLGGRCPEDLAAEQDAAAEIALAELATIVATSGGRSGARR